MRVFKKSISVLMMLVLVLTMLPLGSGTVSASTASGFQPIIPGQQWFFDTPNAVAVDGSGNIYVGTYASDENPYQITRLSPTGVILDSWGILGEENGQINDLADIAADGAGNVYIADSGNNRVLKFSLIEDYYSFSMNMESNGNGEYPMSPSGVAVDSEGNIYVTYMNDNRVEKFNSSGQVVADWWGQASGYQFSQPTDIAVDPHGNVYVVDSGTGQIVELNSAGEFLMTLGGGQLIELQGVTVDSMGNVYAIDASTQQIRKFNSAGHLEIGWGGYGIDDGQFATPCSIAVDSAGNIYVADSDNNRIQKFTSSGGFVKKWGRGGSAGGEFYQPFGAAVDHDGNIYVSDMGNNRIEKFDSTGAFVTTWGNGSNEDRLNMPMGIAVDSAGNVYVADMGNNRIQKFSSTGEYLSTIESWEGSEINLNVPMGLAVDDSDNLYVTELGNSRVQKFDPAGNSLGTLGGTDSGTGPGEFIAPGSVAVDSSGNIYVLDTQNNRVQKFSEFNTESFELAWGSFGGANDQFRYPNGIAVDSAGNVYVADSGNYRVQKFSPAGEFIEKWGSPGVAPGQFLMPGGITLDSNNNIYVVDSGNNRIQKLGYAAPIRYTVTFDSNGGSAVAPLTEVDYNSNVTLPTPPTKAGYTFAGWYKNNDTFADAFTASTPVTGNLTVYAKWTAVPTTYTVTFNTNGGNAVTPVSNVAANATVDLPAPPTKTGYTFAGWYKDNDTFADAFTASTPVTGNLTVYAKWTAVSTTYTVTFNTNGGNAVTPVSNVAANATVDLPAPPTKTGYTFAGWYTDNGTFAHGFTATTPVTGNVTVYAKWTRVSPDDERPSTPTAPAQPSTPATSPTTVTGDIKNGTTGNTVSNITATVNKDSNSQLTLTMPAAQLVVAKQPDGTTSPLIDVAKVAITSEDGTPLAVSANGTLQVSSLAQGTDHIYKISYDFGNGQKINLGTMEIRIDGSGNVADLTVTLIDPYGILTDGTTGEVIAGAHITLYYADTARNKAAGKTPGALVELPILEDFKPNSNRNPQISDVHGAYGFMVFPTTDYYLVATKEGYEEYKSPTISVEQDIVKWDIQMMKPNPGVNRLAGLTRVDTALAIAKATFPGKVNHVVLATAGNYPDALAGSVLAYQLDAPILLAGSTEADQAKVIEYIDNSMDKAGEVYILGGTGVVGADMEAKIVAKGFNHITRLAGKDRYETALKIAERLGVKTGTPIILAHGESYPDALSVSSIAARMESPIFLVPKDGLSKDIKEAMAKIRPAKVYLIGGTGVISTAVAAQTAQLTALDQTNIVRIAGQDRYETSLAVAQHFNEAGGSLCLATGNNFPDALAGSVYAAKHNAPILLVDSSLSNSLSEYVKARNLTGMTLFGGEGAITKEIEEQLRFWIRK